MWEETRICVCDLGRRVKSHQSVVIPVLRHGHDLEMEGKYPTIQSRGRVVGGGGA